MNRRRGLRTIIAVLAVLGFSSNALPAYAPGCTVALDVAGAILHEARAVAIQHDGKIVIAGYADLGLGNKRDFLVARFHPDLSLDTSFNGTGYRVDDLQGLDDEAFGVVVQFDQRIVVGGYSQKSAGQNWMAFARYHRNGTLDTTFGAGGFFFVDFTGSSSEEIRAVAIQPDGKIIGAGFQTPFGVQKLTVVRVLKNGGLDSSFDFNGASDPDITGSAYSFATGVVLQPDGKIVVSGEAGFPAGDFLAVRLLADGSPDTSFDSDGWVATQIGAGPNDSASSLALMTDGKIVLGGTSDGDVAVVRYDSAGSLDTTFGGNGISTHDFGATDSGNAVALDAGGNVLVAGARSLPPSDFALARFRLNGFVDLSKIDDISTGQDDRAFAVAVTRAGKILVAGSSQGPSSPKTTLALYLPDGNQDCGPPVYPVDVFTATSSGDSVNGRVMLNWLNPSYGPYDRTVIRRDTVGCPLTETDGVSVVVQSDGLGAPGSFVDTVPLGAKYYYSAFVLDSASQRSTGVCRSATPFDRMVGKVEWSYDTSIAALSTPGLRLNIPLSESVAYSVSNDGVVHAIQGGGVLAGGGRWPAGYRPFRAFSSVPGRPPVIPLPPASKLAVMLAAQDGHVYAVDALDGSLMWKSAKLATTLQAAPAVVLSAWGGGADLVFIGTREPGLANRLYALNASDGTVAWAFDNGGAATGIGMIVGSASVDYTAKRVYFTSAQGTSDKTVWCLDYTFAPAATCGLWGTYGVAPSGGVSGDIETSPILYQGSLYVSDTLLEELYAINPMDGSDAIFSLLGDGGAKGFVFPHFGTPNLFASTSTSTMSVDSAGANWVELCISTPSTPIFKPGTDWVFVGSSMGKLFQFSAATGAGCPTLPPYACVGNCSTTIVGAPAFDNLKSMLYVGTDDGFIHALRPPF